ncbi:MaoC family dehydratase [Bacillus sp. JJ1562]|uniref:MaoC family dehydratase n=1 Tax=Bacillus sp. JJ1562 TaxID=3122960 RepID=UPI003003276B
MNETKFESRPYKVTQQQINIYANASGGTGKIHTNPEYAKHTHFKGTLVHGLYLVTLIEKELANLYPGWRGMLQVTFISPVKAEQEFKLFFEKEEYENQVKVSILHKNNDVAVVGRATIR